MAFLFGGGSSATTSINIADAKARATVKVKKQDQTGKHSEQHETLLLFTDGEDVGGTVNVRVNPGKKVDHAGVTLQLVGQIGAWPIGCTMLCELGHCLPRCRRWM
jgi:vacuolar protein sorting-associated protein 26